MTNDAAQFLVDSLDHLAFLERLRDGPAGPARTTRPTISH
jgi:hypothetical protein